MVEEKDWSHLDGYKHEPHKIHYGIVRKGPDPEFNSDVTTPILLRYLKETDIRYRIHFKPIRSRLFISKIRRFVTQKMSKWATTQVIDGQIYVEGTMVIRRVYGTETDNNCLTNWKADGTHLDALIEMTKDDWFSKLIKLPLDGSPTSETDWNEDRGGLTYILNLDEASIGSWNQIAVVVFLSPGIRSLQSIAHFDNEQHSFGVQMREEWPLGVDLTFLQMASGCSGSSTPNQVGDHGHHFQSVIACEFSPFVSLEFCGKRLIEMQYSRIFRRATKDGEFVEHEVRMLNGERVWGRDKESDGAARAINESDENEENEMEGTVYDEDEFTDLEGDVDEEEEEEEEDVYEETDVAYENEEEEDVEQRVVEPRPEHHTKKKNRKGKGSKKKKQKKKGKKSGGQRVTKEKETNNNGDEQLEHPSVAEEKSKPKPEESVQRPTPAPPNNKPPAKAMKAFEENCSEDIFSHRAQSSSELVYGFISGHVDPLLPIGYTDGPEPAKFTRLEERLSCVFDDECFVQTFDVIGKVSAQMLAIRRVIVDIEPILDKIHSICAKHMIHMGLVRMQNRLSPLCGIVLYRFSVVFRVNRHRGVVCLPAEMSRGWRGTEKIVTVVPKVDTSVLNSASAMLYRAICALTDAYQFYVEEWILDRMKELNAPEYGDGGRRRRDSVTCEALQADMDRQPSVTCEALQEDMEKWLTGQDTRTAPMGVARERLLAMELFAEVLDLMINDLEMKGTGVDKNKAERVRVLGASESMETRRVCPCPRHGVGPAEDQPQVPHCAHPKLDRKEENPNEHGGRHLIAQEDEMDLAIDRMIEVAQKGGQIGELRQDAEEKRDEEEEKKKELVQDGTTNEREDVEEDLRMSAVWRDTVLRQQELLIQIAEKKLLLAMKEAEVREKRETARVAQERWEEIQRKQKEEGSGRNKEREEETRDGTTKQTTRKEEEEKRKAIEWMRDAEEKMKQKKEAEKKRQLTPMEQEAKRKKEKLLQEESIEQKQKRLAMLEEAEEKMMAFVRKNNEKVKRSIARQTEGRRLWEQSMAEERASWQRKLEKMEGEVNKEEKEEEKNDGSERVVVSDPYHLTDYLKQLGIKC